MPTTRFLRPTSSNTWDVFIDRDEPVAHIEASEALRRIGFTVTDLQGTVLAEDTDLLTLVRRLAEGEFDNDFRFEIAPWDEPEMGCTHTVTMLATPSQKVMESFTTDNPYGAVEAAREAQAYSLEERLGEYGLEWQREQRERS